MENEVNWKGRQHLETITSCIHYLPKLKKKIGKSFYFKFF